MARKEPSSPGGKLLASEILLAIQDNNADMKSNGANRDAKSNELIGNTDLANAIAIAVEKVFGTALIAIPGPATPVPLVATPYPVTVGTIDLSLANPKYSFKGA